MKRSGGPRWYDVTLERYDSNGRGTGDERVERVQSNTRPRARRMAEATCRRQGLIGTWIAVRETLVPKEQR